MSNNHLPQEGDPLLRDSKSNQTNGRRGTNRSGTNLMACLGAMALFLIVVGVVKWQNITLLSFTRRSSSNISSPQVSSDQWWMHSSKVQKTETRLPGQLPKKNNSSLRQNDRQLRWGILGLGRIARDFTTALIMTGANITAVAAGSLANATLRAQDFAKHYGVPQSYGSYDQLANDPNVDMVYVATTNQLHYEPALKMLQTGKNVLIEKPMTLHLEEAQNVAQAAREGQRLLLTNYWTRFFPVIKYVRSVLANSDRLGPISSMHGDFGFPTPPNPNDRYLNRTTGGGAMLDVGCYLVNLVVMVQQQPSSSKTVELPSRIEATAQRSYLGTSYKVDSEIAFQLGWDSDIANNLTQATSAQSAMIMSGQASFRRPSNFEVEIDGTHGRLVIHGPANAATTATIYDYEPFGPLQRVEQVRSQLPLSGNRFGPQSYPRGEGFVYIIHEIEQCMMEHGIPGRDGRPGCLGLEELAMEEQLLTVQITETVLQRAGYWDWQ